MWGIASVPTMKPSPSYLTRNRHGTFYFRIVIPRPLRALLHGQREVRHTLKTDSERLARKRARQYVARYEAVFDKVVNMVERDELGLTEADYKELMELVPDFSSPQDESNPAEPVLYALAEWSAKPAWSMHPEMLSRGTPLAGTRSYSSDL